jgi:L-seryl-tRNA(Ser) seleniumtransferase
MSGPPVWRPGEPGKGPSGGAASAGGRRRARAGASDARNEALRGLAAVDEVLREPAVVALAEAYPRDVVVEAVRTVISRLRREILEGGREGDAVALTPAHLVPWIEQLVETVTSPSLRRVINATGIVAHTNLGRAVLPADALDAVAAAAGSYSDLEFDLASGERRTRQRHVRDTLCTLTGADDALVVNNNAAAVLLALAATCRDGDVVVSRGQLVEIGDGFRIPDILAESGARLVEVGTTNRTYLRDVERAWGEGTRAVLRVHTSNYRIVGFTAAPSVEELVTFAHEHGALVIDDLGSGALSELALFGDEPSARESLRLGVDVVTFSGDKLLGGPQAGIALGTGAVIERMRTHPLARAVRIDKLSLAALDALLRLYLDPARAVERVPTLAMLAQSHTTLAARAELLRDALSAPGDVPYEAVESVARAGAGALPVTEVPSVALAVTPPDGDAGGLAARLRRGTPAVVAHVHDDRVLLDLLTVRDSEVDELAAAVLAALASA